MTAVGLLLVVVTSGLYLWLAFIVHRIRYPMWWFNAAVGLGMALAAVGWALGGNGWVAVSALVLGAVWFLATRDALRLAGSDRLSVGVGDAIPSFRLATTDGDPFTDRDLVAHAPALLVLYRGWWCPYCNTQLDELTAEQETLEQAGIRVFAASVDQPEQAAALQDRLGGSVTLLCDVGGTLLDTIGVRDRRGAPWYDRLIFGAPRRAVSMPAALVVDDTGHIIYAYRSPSADVRPHPKDIVASLTDPST